MGRSTEAARGRGVRAARPVEVMPLPAEIPIIALVTLVAGIALGWWTSRRGFARGVHELHSYVEGWEEGERQGEERAREALTQVLAPAGGAGRGRRSMLTPVFQKLDQHRLALLKLRSLSTATTRRLQKLLDVVSEAVLLYDPSGQLLYVNGKTRQLAGDSEEEALDGSSGDEEALRRVEALLSASTDLDAFVRSQLERDEPDPEGREIEVSVGEAPRRFFATPYLIRSRRDPTCEGLLLLLTDVEALEDVRLNAQCRVALEHGQLAAELMAHRLRNPLNSIVLVMELIRRESSGDGKVGKHLETIGSEVGRLEGTLQRFLEMVRGRERRDESVDLVSVVETVSELLYPLARDRQVRVRQELHVPAATLRGDSVEVVRAVLGPALAALREAEPGAELKLRLDSERREHLLLIESAGVRPGSIGLTVAEELTARNQGTLSYDDPAHPARLTYRFAAETGA